MALSIKDQETDGLVRRLATARKLSYTAAIKLAVSNELARELARPPIDWDAIAEIQREWAKHPPLDMKEVDDWMYDENGAPH